MKKTTLVFITMITILLSASLSHGFAKEAQRSSIKKPNRVSLAGGAPWLVQHLDGAAGNSVGTYPSVAFNSVGLPYVSYYNINLGELWLASPVSDGSGNCGVENKWWCRVVDTNGDVGKYSSIDLWKSDNITGMWKLGISYFDTTNRSLKVATYTCSGMPPCEWELGIVDVPILVSQSVGMGTSLKFSSDGIPHVAYYYSYTLGNDSIRYAYQVPSGGNCGMGSIAGLWNCDNVDIGDRVGQFPSLDLLWDNSLYMTYYDEGNGNLKYAYYGGIGDCGTGNAWICGVIDGTDGSDVGLYTSLKAPQSVSDKYRIAYYDKTHAQLKIAYTVTSGGNCGSGGWQCDVVDDMGTSISPMGISMAVDTLGNPIIAYQQIASVLSPSVLRIARPALALGLDWGNCGDVPPGYLFQYWQCDTIDNASSNTSEADYVSVALDPSGLATIAYSEYDSYDDFNNLKIAYQTFNNLYLPITVRAH